MTSTVKGVASLRLFVLLMAGLALLPAQAQFALSSLPNLAAPPNPTNLVLTIDDSGSMSSAFVPDVVGNNANTWAFTSPDYNGMYYNPKATYQVPPNAANVQASDPCPQTSFLHAYIDGFNPAQGYVDLSGANTPPPSTAPTATCGSLNPGGAYQATQQYGPFDTKQSFATPTNTPSSTYGGAYYFLFNTAATGCAKPVPWLAPPADTCFTYYAVTSTSADAANFAIWYSFYRTRHLAIASAAALAMADSGLASTRVAWQGLTTCNDFTSGVCNNQGNGGTNNRGNNGGGNAAATTPVDNRLRTFADTPTSTHKTDFYTWLRSLPASSDTPTRTAWNRTGQYFSSSGPNSPYGLDPNNNSTSTKELACVNNFQITLTDGQWNDGNGNYCGTGTCGNEDSNGVTLPDQTTYSPNAAAKSSTSIYSDYNVGGLADIAFYYWSHNLRPDLTGTITGQNGPVRMYVTDASTTNPITGSTTDTNWWYWNPRNDPATWPHMVNFTIGVGLTGYLTLPGLFWNQDSFGGMSAGATTLNGSGYADLLSYANVCTDTTGNMSSPPNCNWPIISTGGGGGGAGGGQGTQQGGQGGGQQGGQGGGQGGNAGNVYDLWHAAVNSRGQAFSAESPTDLLAAMQTIIKRVEVQAAGAGVAAGSSGMLSTSSTLYVATYDGSDWHGVLGAFAINPPTSPNAGAVAPSPTWSTLNPNSIPAVSSRNVYTSLVTTPLPGSGVSVTLTGNPFNSTDTNLQGSTQWPVLISGTGLTDQVSVVNYLLGDATNEIPNSGTVKYRSRPLTKLGDIVNSSPVFSYDENFGYQVLENGTNPEPVGSYETYLSTTKPQTGRPAMIYVGANDGMLHAFNASAPASGSGTTASPGIAPTASGTMGQELFAYVPHAVVPNLGLLTNPNYSHHFYVDSTPYVGDAYLGGSWRTVLVGATGAGGKGVFALDVSNPQSFGASNVLWDMDGSTFGNGDPDLGYTIGQPVVVRLNDNRWYAAFGNGYLSGNQCPVLYLVQLDNGNNVMRLHADGTPAAPCAVANGLGAPTPLDMDGNGTTDYIYAGDLQGHMWKFDVHATNNTAWGPATITGQTTPGLLFTAKPPGTATTLQPIVGAPTLGSGPNGVMLYFSTGHLFAVGDPTDLSVQSVYGIQDSGVAIASRANLVAQTITTAANGIDRMVSSSLVSLSGSNFGWVLDLEVGTNALGERVTQQPILVDNVIVFVSNTPDATSCAGGGCATFLYGLNALSGGGGIDFFSDAGVFYDAISSGAAGCLTGITVIRESGSSVLTYGFGPKFNNGGGQNPSNPPATGNTPHPPPPQPGCTANVDCTRDNVPNQTGRKSWHEMVQ